MVTMTDDMVQLLLSRIDRVQDSLDSMRKENSDSLKEHGERLRIIEQRCGEREHYVNEFKEHCRAYKNPDDWFNGKVVGIVWASAAGIAGWLLRTFF